MTGVTSCGSKHQRDALKNMFFRARAEIASRGISASFHCSDVSVTLFADVAVFIEWTSAYFDGFFSRGPGGSGAHRVYATAELNYFAALDQVVDQVNGGTADVRWPERPILFDFGRLQCMRRTSGGSGHDSHFLLLDRETGEVLVIALQSSRDAKFAVMRAVRSYIILLLAHNGCSYLHGAAAAHSSCGIVIVGDKFAGKTTLLLQLLKANRCSFVSNDKVALRKKALEIEVLGFPIAIGVRAGTLLNIPELADLCPVAEDGKQWTCVSHEPLARLNNFAKSSDLNRSEKSFFKAQRLTKELGVSVASSALVRLLIAPQYDAGARAVCLVRMDKADVVRLLRRQYLDGIGAVTPEHAFFERLSPTDWVSARLYFDELADHIAATVPCFHLMQNVGSTQQTMRLIRQLWEDA